MVNVDAKNAGEKLLTALDGVVMSEQPPLERLRSAIVHISVLNAGTFPTEHQLRSRFENLITNGRTASSDDDIRTCLEELLRLLRDTSVAVGHG
jgi:hypothetical protein